jgi:hypothetical protein
MVGIMQARTGRAQVSEQQMRDMIAFYYGSAPVELPMLPYTESASPRRFTAREVGAPSALPMITHVAAGAGGTGLLASDGETGRVWRIARDRDAWRERPLADIRLPVHTQEVDLDADGDHDILVADLGEFPPVEDPVGRLWLLRQATAGAYDRELLAEGLGRVSDARVADLDHDGDLDIAVAVFGGGDRGEAFWLENTGGGAAPNYRRHGLIAQSGAITLLPADLDADGRTDLVLLLAQEHESILVFRNRGAGVFERHTLAQAPHPMFGSTSLGVVDLDRDGDSDLLYTNGDAFDAQTDPKPYHGVQWLENRGGMKFAFHDIGRFYGASTAAAGDLDGDGDLDVVAGSWVNHWNDARRYAVIWYENDGRQNFAAHGIATRPAGIASLQLVDVTGDGALDIVAGAIRMDLLMAKYGARYSASRLFPAADGKPQPRVMVFENGGPPPAAAP